MGLFDVFKNKSNNTTVNVCDEDTVFEHILKVFFDFKDKYHNKVISIGIYPSKKATGYVAFDIVFYLDGKIDWLKSNETTELLDYFEMVEDDGTFQTFECTRNTFEESNNYKHIDQKLKSCVRHFMNEHPDRNFDLSKTGATIKFW